MLRQLEQPEVSVNTTAISSEIYIPHNIFSFESLTLVFLTWDTLWLNNYQNYHHPWPHMKGNIDSRLTPAAIVFPPFLGHNWDLVLN